MNSNINNTISNNDSPNNHGCLDSIGGCFLQSTTTTTANNNNKEENSTESIFLNQQQQQQRQCQQQQYIIDEVTTSKQQQKQQRKEVTPLQQTPVVELVLPQQDHVDRAFAQDLLSMTQNERERILQDIHGIDNTNTCSQQSNNNSPTMIKEKQDTAIFEMEEELFRIGQRSQAYNIAVQQNESYVQRLYLSFLMKYEYDVPCAAQHLLHHFDFKFELWKMDTLGRDVTQDDMDRETLDTLKRGFFQILPVRDVAGRAIFTKIWKYTQFQSEVSVHRALWYLRMTMLNDEETSNTMEPGVT